MRTFLFAVSVVLLLALTPPVSAQEPREAHVEMEIEPVAFLFDGAGAHVGYLAGRWSYTQEVFGLTVPPALHGHEGFTAAPIGAEFHLERFFSETRGGFYAGPEIGVNRLELTHRASHATRHRIRYAVGVRGGYQWYPGWGDLYLSPVVGLVYTLNAEPITIWYFQRLSCYAHQAPYAHSFR